MRHKTEKQYRLPNHNYLDNGWYFVTFCTQGKEDNLGNVIACANDSFVDLSDIGKIVNKYWQELPNRFLEIKLDEYIIMPNHIHGIINIRRHLIYQMPTDTPVNLINQIPTDTQNQTPVNLINQIPTRINQTPARTNQISANDRIPVNLINQIPTDTKNKKNNQDIFRSGIKNNPMEMKKNSLGKIIRYFKGLSTYNIRRIYPNFAWQPRFHDRVIRNQGELNRIRDYIIKNPSAWHRDRNLPINKAGDLKTFEKK